MKKILAMILALAMVFALCACGQSAAPAASTEPEAKTLKFGFIYLHNDQSTYDKNFRDAAIAACEKLGVEYVEYTNIPEGQECYEKAVDLVEQGCSLVFADSFGHEDFMISAAKEYPDVQFCHATGTRAHTEGLANFHNAFASIYEGRYLAGVAAGMKLKEMIDNGTITADQAKMGYIGAFTYAEVISGYTSFFLGARSIVPEVKMDVTFTGSWYDYDAEQQCAKNLIANGCVLISQHADSLGAPTACQENPDGPIPNVSYNGSTKAAGPDSYIIASRINWEPYFEYIINCVKNGEAIDTDWTGTIATGSVELAELNEAVAAPGTAEAIAEAEAAFAAGTLHVFDTANFTVGGLSMNSYLADVDTDASFTPDTEVVSDGYFHESEFRSAPYFDVQIDGINLLDTAF